MENVFIDGNMMCQKEIAAPRRQRMDNQWVWVWTERDHLKFYLPLWTGHYRDGGKLAPVRILSRLLSVFLGSHVQGPKWVGFIVESVALVSTRMWQGFPLILILLSHWLCKGITDSTSQENPWESHQHFRGRYGGLWAAVKGFNRASECITIFSPVCQLGAMDTQISEPCFDDGHRGCKRGPGVLGFWLWSCCSWQII